MSKIVFSNFLACLLMKIHLSFSIDLDNPSKAIPKTFIMDSLGTLGERIVTSAGDFNDDGIDDLIVGVPQTLVGGYVNAGRVYVIFGKTGGFEPLLDFPSVLTPSEGFYINGPTTNSRLGISMGLAGDVNNDGIDDIILGGVNRVFVIFGSRQTRGNINLDTLDPVDGFEVFGITILSPEVGFAGDFNKDGIDDFFIWTSSGFSSRPLAIILFGQNGLSSLDLDTFDFGSHGFIITTDENRNVRVQFFQSIGDINKDGVDDLLMSISFPDNGSIHEQTMILYGRSNRICCSNLDPFLSNLVGLAVVISSNLEENFGEGISSAGDINDDGIADFMISAPEADYDNRNSAGKVYVFYGKNGDFPPNLHTDTLSLNDGFYITGPESEELLGLKLSRVGDFNQDGIDDIIISASWANPNEKIKAGKVYVIYGRKGKFKNHIDLKNGLSKSEGFTIMGASPADRLGFYVSFGDFDHDEKPDLLLSINFPPTRTYILYNSCLLRGDCPEVCDPPFILSTDETSCVWTQPNGVMISISVIEVTHIKSLVSTSNEAQAVSTTSLILQNFIYSSSPSRLLYESLKTMQRFGRHLNVSYSPRLLYFFMINTDPPFLPFEINFAKMSPKLKETFEHSTLPYVFEKFQIHSNFMVNFWDNLFVILMLLGLMVFWNFVHWQSKWLRNQPRLCKVSQRFRIVTSSLLIGQIYEEFGEMVSMTILHFQTTKLEINSLTKALSVIVPLLCITFGLIFLIFHWRLIKKYQNKKKTVLEVSKEASHLDFSHLLHFQKSNQMVQVLYEDFKDISSYQQGFLLIITARNIFYYIIITCLIAFPNVQTFLLLMMQIGLLVFMGKKQPFKSRLAFTEHVLFELSLSIINFCWLILAIIPPSKEVGNEGSKLIHNLSEIILIINVAYSFLPLLFLGLKLFHSAFLLFKIILIKKKSVSI